MSARLYVTSLSNPSKAAMAMLAYKQLPHRVVNLTSGFHPYLVRAAGFQGPTVPALRLDNGRRVQGSLGISPSSATGPAASSRAAGRGRRGARGRPTRCRPR